ncbi:MAG: hypothetical protein MUE94_12075 [Verrucomicrobia bacterium]|jgi:hypothetical protein|nr:hypothetical protein [Verrucomicrobiota bacterium]
MRPKFLIGLGVGVAVVIALLLVFKKPGSPSKIIPPDADAEEASDTSPEELLAKLVDAAIPSSMDQPKAGGSKPEDPATREDSTTEATSASEKVESSTTRRAPDRHESPDAPSPSQVAQEIKAKAEQMKRDWEREIELWQSPLVYFGKVVDENEAAIPRVQVSYSARAMNEAREEIRDTGTVTTDGRGVFKISGINGVGLMIELSHPDYYSYPDNSTGFDKRSVPRSGYFSDTEDKAEIFRMHRRGNPVALIERHGGLHTPPDGTPATFSFRGRTRAEIIGQGQIEGWKSSPDPKSNGRYDWNVKITMPSGSILESTNRFDFVAPELGYQKSCEITMTKEDPNWQSHIEKRYFFKLPGYYVRGNVSVDIYHDLYFSMQYFVNPDGSTNLENDPNQPFQEP